MTISAQKPDPASHEPKKHVINSGDDQSSANREKRKFKAPYPLHAQAKMANNFNNKTEADPERLLGYKSSKKY